MFDVLILNGVVVDGTGAGGYRADVGVVGERIDAIGDLARAETRRVINAAGLTVALGFIESVGNISTLRRRSPREWLSVG